MTGTEPECRGNRSPYWAPNNVYRCSRQDRWITIAAATDEQWQHLARLVEGSQLACDSRFATLTGRLSNQDELDGIITRWTSGQDPFLLTHQLQEAGVPSGAVMRAPDLLNDPHYAARGTFVTVDHPLVGPRRYPGIPWKMSVTPGQVRSPAPCLGQHNAQVYGELLGMSEDQVTGLEDRGVVGTKPLGSRII